MFASNKKPGCETRCLVKSFHGWSITDCIDSGYSDSVTRTLHMDPVQILKKIYPTSIKENIFIIWGKGLTKMNSEKCFLCFPKQKAVKIKLFILNLRICYLKSWCHSTYKIYLFSFEIYLFYSDKYKKNNGENHIFKVGFFFFVISCNMMG